MNNIKYFHCTPDRSDYLKLYPNTFHILASAYRIKKFPKIKKYLHLANEVFIDSGMISAWKKNEIEWSNNQHFVLEVAQEVNADYVAMLDLPSEPYLLNANGLTTDEALKITIRNAITFLDATTPAKKVFVIQGWRLQDYHKCIEKYKQLGILDLQDIWIGIGSVCMRSPRKDINQLYLYQDTIIPGLYEVASFIRKQIPNHHIHCFGIGKPKWIQELMKIGINSFDSASASIQVAFNRGETKVNGPRNDKIVYQQFGDAMMIQEKKIKEINNGKQ